MSLKILGLIQGYSDTPDLTCVSCYFQKVINLVFDIISVKTWYDGCIQLKPITGPSIRPDCSSQQSKLYLRYFKRALISGNEFFST